MIQVCKGKAKGQKIARVSFLDAARPWNPPSLVPQVNEQKLRSGSHGEKIVMQACKSKLNGHKIARVLFFAGDLSISEIT